MATVPITGDTQAHSKASSAVRTTLCGLEHEPASSIEGVISNTTLAPKYCLPRPWTPLSAPVSPIPPKCPSARRQSTTVYTSAHASENARRLVIPLQLPMCSPFRNTRSLNNMQGWSSCFGPPRVILPCISAEILSFVA